MLLTYNWAAGVEREEGVGDGGRGYRKRGKGVGEEGTGVILFGNNYH